MNETDSTTCPYCGDEMPPNRGPARKQCGKPECKRLHTNAMMRKWMAKHPGYRGRYKRKNVYSYERTCVRCGDTFKTKRHDGRYCSRSCYALDMRKTGVELVVHPGPFSVLPPRHPARQKPGYRRTFVECRCQICGEHFIAIGVRHATCGREVCVAKKRSAEQHARRAYERALTRGRVLGVFSASDWGRRLREYGSRCAYCGSSEDIQIEHVFPLCRGGSNLVANIVPACRECNQEKGMMTPDEWIASGAPRVNCMDTRRFPSGAWGERPVLDYQRILDAVQASDWSLV